MIEADILVIGIIIVLAAATAYDIRSRKVPLELWVIGMALLIPFSLDQYLLLPQRYLMFMSLCTVAFSIFLYACKVHHLVGGADVIAMALVSWLSLPVVFSVAFWVFTIAAGAVLILNYYAIARCKEIHVPYMAAILAGFVLATQYPVTLIITG